MAPAPGDDRGRGRRGSVAGPSLPDEFNAELRLLLQKKLTVRQIRDFLSGEFTPLPVGDVLAVVRAAEKAGVVKITPKPAVPETAARK